MDIKNRVLVFKNPKNDLTTQLHMGYIDGKPVYQFSSKEIPITGEFTGYPKTIFMNWMKKIGYEYMGEYAYHHGNQFRDACIGK